MAVLGGMKNKKIESDNHLVASFSHQKLQGQAAGSAFRPRLPLLCPCKAPLQLGSEAKS